MSEALMGKHGGHEGRQHALIVARLHLHRIFRIIKIGIPPFDVIQVSTDKGVSYVELTADAF